MIQNFPYYESSRSESADHVFCLSFICLNCRGFNIFWCTGRMFMNMLYTVIKSCFWSLVLVHLGHAWSIGFLAFFFLSEF